jgi:hypothetical protein
MMKKIYNLGIYSFPKSGNTWVRNVLAEHFNIKKGDYGKYLPDIHQGEVIGTHSIANHSDAINIYKSHTNYEIKAKPAGENINLVVIRNPLDVFLSYLNFISDNVTGDSVIKFKDVKDAEETGVLDVYFSCFLVFGHLQPGFYNKTNSYFQHCNYWLKRSEEDNNTFILRYEDMLLGNFSSLYEALSLAGIEQSSIEKTIKGFAANKDGKFYWKMSSYNFSEYLSKDQISLFTKVHNETLSKLGYLTDYNLIISK